ncbi:MAG: hypothetical protein J0H15_07005 [Xanthomonadales bacterium]|nr:hypothetical protein [Xanthomonadales bacterium]
MANWWDKYSEPAAGAAANWWDKYAADFGNVEAGSASAPDFGNAVAGVGVAAPERAFSPGELSGEVPFATDDPRAPLLSALREEQAATAEPPTWTQGQGIPGYTPDWLRRVADEDSAPNRVLADAAGRARHNPVVEGAEQRLAGTYGAASLLSAPLAMGLDAVAGTNTADEAFRRYEEAKAYAQSLNPQADAGIVDHTLRAVGGLGVDMTIGALMGAAPRVAEATASLATVPAFRSALAAAGRDGLRGAEAVIAAAREVGGAAASIVAEAVPQLVRHAAPVATAPAIAGGAETAASVMEAGGSTPEALTAGLVDAAGTVGEFALPLGAAGRLPVRAAQGAASNLAGSDLHNRLVNPFLPPELQRSLSGNDAAPIAVTGALLGGVLGEHAPARSRLDRVRELADQVIGEPQTPEQQAVDVGRQAAAAAFDAHGVGVRDAIAPSDSTALDVSPLPFEPPRAPPQSVPSTPPAAPADAPAADYTAEPIRNGRSVLYRGDVPAMKQALEDAGLSTGFRLVENGQETGLYFPTRMQSEVDAALAPLRAASPPPAPTPMPVAPPVETGAAATQSAIAEPEAAIAETAADEGPREHRTEGAIHELPVADLALSRDVPQFKDGASAETGVVEPLGGTFDRRGTGPIQVWRRKDGRLEVISGRHRLDLARRSGEATIPAQVYDESAGFTAAQAASLDAELNIRDGQGKVADYVQFFQQSAFDGDAGKAEADARGLLARATGKRAYAIARQGDAELIAAHRAGRVSDEAAVQIAQAAPNNAAAQALGMRLLQDGKPIHTATNTMRAAMAMRGDRPAEQGDIFGFDDSAIQDAIAMAGVASRKQRELSERLAAVTGAAKRPGIARREGVDVRDPESLPRRIAEMRAEKAEWDDWATDPAKVQAIRAELGMPALPDRASTIAEEAEPTFVDEATEAMFSRAQEAGARPDETEAARREWAEKGTESRFFKRWFGDSKTVGADGQPQPLYHGRASDWTEARGETWLTDDADVAARYAEAKGGDSVLKLYARIRNPAMIESNEDAEAALRQGGLSDAAIQRLRPEDDRLVYQWFESREALDALASAGYDGIHLTDDTSDAGAHLHDSWMALRPEQIKSATDNRGTFDPENPNILFSRRRGDTSTGDMFGAAPETPKPASPARAAYDAAMAATGIEAERFQQAREDYRARRIDDEAFLAARKRHDEAQASADAAERAYSRPTIQAGGWCIEAPDCSRPDLDSGERHMGRQQQRAQ